MILSAASIVQTIVQATLLLAASALLVQGLIWLSRCVSANIQRIAWCLALVQGLMFVPLSLHIPWYESPPAASATADTRLATARDLAGDSAGDRPQEHFQQATRSSPGRPSLDTAAANPLLAETMPSPASRGFTGRFAGVWQCVLLLWGLGLVSCLVVGLRRYVRFVRRIQTVESPDEEWGTQWCQLLASRGVRRAIPFRVARDVGPALIWRPSGYEVVVPEAAWRRLTAGQRRLILRHELAHYEHGDLWRSLAVRLLALPHWFNPLSWWVVRKFEDCTEWLCDCAAANSAAANSDAANSAAANSAAAKASAIEYARALMQLGSSPFRQTSGVGAAHGSRLFHRIRRLISNPFMEDSKMKKCILISAALGLLLVGGVRIHLVAKEPSASGDRKPAAAKPQTDEDRAKKPDENENKKPSAKPAAKAAEKPKRLLADLSEFPDEPAAHALFDRMIETLQKADSLSYRSRATTIATSRTDSCIVRWNRVWLKKPNYCRVEGELTSDGPKLAKYLRQRGQSILVGDGKTFWIYWPLGRPQFNSEDADIHQKTCMNSYLKSSATSDNASMEEEMAHMGGGYPAFDISIFHNRKTMMQKSIDAVRSRGIERVGGEECDKIEVTEFDECRWTFWLSKINHLPRKVEYLFHVDWVENAYDQITTEEWPEVKLNADMPNTLFAWQPPKGWTEWRFPEASKEMLKRGDAAPDFKLLSADGKPIQLSDYRGRPVWLCFWAAYCWPDEAETKPGGRYDLRRIQKIYEQYKDSGLIVLGYNATDDAALALKTMRDNGITFPTILDASDEARRIRSQGYKINGYEVKDYVIDRTGKIIVGFYDQGEDENPFLEKADGALQFAGGELGAIVQRKIDARVARSTDEVSAAARRLFQAIREADYNRDWTKPKDWRQFPAKDARYDVARGFPGWVQWVCNKFKTNPIVDVQLGKVFADPEGRPTVHFRLTLKDGEILEGDLPFVRTYNPRHGRWIGFEALDWHLQKKPAKKP